MSSVVKTYHTASGELRFEFVYSALLGSLDDFDIVDISPLRYGFDSDDPKAISVYPANIEITIDDLTGDNYTRFRKFFSHYNAVYPFNHYNVLHLVITLSGEVIFKGLIDKVGNEYADRTVTIDFVDGINRYKDAQIGNPYLLDRLWFRGVLPRTSSEGNAYAYGFGSLPYLTHSSGGQTVHSPGYFPGNIQSGDMDARLDGVIRELIWCHREDLTVSYQNELRYGDENTPVSEMVGIEQLRVRRVLSNLFGRYVAIRKITGLRNRIADVEPRLEYQSPDRFEVVFEDDDYVVFRHNWDGVLGDGTVWEKGVEEKKVSDILRLLAVNTFSYYGLSGSSKFFFQHKRFSSDPVNLTFVKEMSKSLMIDKVNEVVINDYYTGNYARKGNDYNIDDQRLEYKIPLNAFRTLFGWEYRMNYYADTAIKRVIYFYDPALSIRDIPQEYLSLAEWQYHKDHLSQYEFELSGIDYHMDKTYRINVDNYDDYLRPVTIEKHLLDDFTNMTALQI